MNSVKERPIPFNVPMVRAVLEGQKTQTRRIMKPQPISEGNWLTVQKSKTGYSANSEKAFKEGAPFHAGCPFGRTGDRLWVRESAKVNAVRGGLREIDIEYQADGLASTVEYPSRLAPAPLGKLLANGTYREASRILLEITNIRVERLQEISEADALAEGVTLHPVKPSRAEKMARDAYRMLLESIYGSSSWDANPWVWVIEFQRVKP